MVKGKVCGSQLSYHMERIVVVVVPSLSQSALRYRANSDNTGPTSWDGLVFKCHSGVRVRVTRDTGQLNYDG